MTWKLNNDLIRWYSCYPKLKINWCQFDMYRCNLEPIDSDYQKTLINRLLLKSVSHEDIHIMPVFDKNTYDFKQNSPIYI